MNLNLSGKTEYILDDDAVNMPWRFFAGLKHNLRHPRTVGEQQIFPTCHDV